MARTSVPSRGIKKPGSLTRIGYDVHEPDETRRRALGKAVRRFGHKRTGDKLVDVQVLDKKRAPEVTATVKEDRSWLRREYRPSSPRLGARGVPA